MSANKPAFILDSFAILAYFNQEAGGQHIRDLLLEAKQKRVQLLLPLVNLGEVAYITEREKGMESVQEMLSIIQQTAIRVLPADHTRVMEAAHLKANYPISYSDAFVAAAALEYNAVVLSGDPEFKGLKDLLNVEWIEG